MSGWRLRPRPTDRATSWAGAGSAERTFLGCVLTRGRGPMRPAGALVLPTSSRRAGRPLPVPALPPTSSTTRRVRRVARRARLRLVARRSRPDSPWPGRCTTTRSTRRWPPGSRPPPRRGDGWACASTRRAGVRRRRAARALLGAATSWQPEVAPARWRPPTSGPAGRATRGDLDDALARAGRGAVVRAVGRRLGRGGPRCSQRFPDRPRRWASRPGTTGTNRPTCSRPRSRSTSATPAARRSCSRSATAGIVFLPGAGRHGPGGLPGRLRELLRRRVVGRADGAGRRDTGPASSRPGRCCRSLARGRAMERTSTSWTPSRKP